MLGVSNTSSWVVVLARPRGLKTARPRYEPTGSPVMWTAPVSPVRYARETDDEYRIIGSALDLWDDFLGGSIPLQLPVHNKCCNLVFYIATVDSEEAKGID